jgi:predicted acylesterase/phospholipase RssA
VVGSSVGGLIGALRAAGLASGEMLAVAERLDWRNSASWTLPWRGPRTLDGPREAAGRATGGRRIEWMPRALGAWRVVAVDVAYRPHEAPAQGLGDIAFQAMHILVNRLADEQVRRANQALRLDLHHLMMR